VRRWFVGLSTPRRTLLLLTLVAVVALVVALVVTTTRGATADASADSAVADPERVAELEAAEIERDEQNLVASIDHAWHLQDELVPVLHGLHAVLPVDGSAATPADVAEIAAWHGTVDGLIAETDALASGSSEHNIVRNGMLTSLRLIDDTLDTVELAVSADDPATAEELEELAGELRTRAVETWSIAATQLDLRSIAADRGHVHIFLPVRPDDALDGGLDGHEVPGEHGDHEDHEDHEDHDH